LRILRAAGARQITCVGPNYRDPLLNRVPNYRTNRLLFGKFASALIGPGEPIVLPRVARRADRADARADRTPARSSPPPSRPRSCGQTATLSPAAAASAGSDSGWRVELELLRCRRRQASAARSPPTMGPRSGDCSPKCRDLRTRRPTGLDAATLSNARASVKYQRSRFSVQGCHRGARHPASTDREQLATCSPPDRVGCAREHDRPG
jgi:hypothetical protein